MKCCMVPGGLSGVQRLSGTFSGLFLSFVLLLAMSTTAVAQLEGKIAEQPLGIMFARDFTPNRVVTYVQRLCARLELAAEMMKEIPMDELQKMQSSVSRPVNGMALYMVHGLLPSFETLQFQEVADEEDAKKLINFRLNQFGGNASLQSEGNGGYVLENHWSWKNPVAEGQDEASLAAQYGNGNRSFRVDVRIVEEDGKRMAEVTNTMTSHFRYNDGMLFEANFSELQDMVLPSHDSLLQMAGGDGDLGLTAYFERIPPGIKQLGWNMLNSGISSQIQQRDGENDLVYRMRRSSADLLLVPAQAALFDTDSASGWVRYAHDQTPSVHGQLRIAARANSQLTKTLEQTASGRSRFAPILRDNAAATIHLCLRFPDEAQNLLDAAGTWLQQVIAEESGQQPEMVHAAEGLSTMLTGISEHRVIELLLKAGWTQESGGVFYGGLQVDSESPLLQSLYDLLVHVPNAPPELINSVALIERHDFPMIRVMIPEEQQGDLKREIGLAISHFYLAHQNSCLWFAAGGENASEIIRQSLARCEAAGYAARTPLFSARLDLQRWLEYPADDPTGIAGWARWLDENAEWFPPSPLVMTGMDATRGRVTPLLQPVFALGGDQDAQLTVDADESGIVVDAKLGEAVANYYLARMISWQDRMMKAQREQVQEQQRRVKEAEEAARASMP